MDNQEMETSEKQNLAIKYLSEKIQQDATDDPEELPVNEEIDGKSIPVLNNVGNHGAEATFKISSCKDINKNLTDKRPQVIYKSSSKSKHRMTKKSKSYKPAIKLKKSYKQSNRSMNKKLKKCINVNVPILNKKITESLSKIVSSCPMLKQVPAKESLIDDPNLAIENIEENNEDHTPSLCSANSTISNFSQNTITLKIDIETSRNLNKNGDSVMILIDQPIKQNIINVASASVGKLPFGAIKSVDTLIGEHDSTDNITPYPTSIEALGQSSEQLAIFASSESNSATSVDENKKARPFTAHNKRFYYDPSETKNVNGGSAMLLMDQPIKPNVINIARAQVDNISFSTMKSFDTLIGEQDLNNNTDIIYLPRESTPYSTSIETLGHSSDQGAFFTSSEPSSVTLVDEDKKVQQFTEDTNCFKISNMHFLSQSDESSKNYLKVPLSNTKRSLMDTVNDLGMFPEITPQKSEHNFHDCIVAERLITNFNPLVKEINEKQKTKYNQNNDSNFKPVKGVARSLNTSKLEKLINKTTTENIRKLNEKIDTNTCIEKRRNGNPSCIAELWEKLAEALDQKVQKLEESLTASILSEIKEYCNILENFKKLFDAKKESKVIDIERNIDKLLTKLDEDLQCNLMIEPAKPKSTEVALSNVFLNDTKGVQYKLDPSFEVLKPAVKSAGDSQDFISIVVDKTVTSPEPRSHRLRTPFAAIRYFFKENLIVLAGAPVFLGALVCMYLIVVLIVNSM